MTITINDQKADISLEGEESLKEVIIGIDNWLKQRGFLMSSALLNGRAIPIDIKSMQETSTQNIEQLDIYAHELNDLILENTGTLFQYFYLLKSNIQNEYHANTAELLIELPHITANIDNILQSPKQTFSTKLLDLINQADIQNGVCQGDTQPLLQFLDTLLRYLENLIREKSDPKSEFTKSLKALELSLPAIRDVTVLLQTGKDMQAMETIIAFTELTAKLARLSGAMSENNGGEESISENHAYLTDFFMELNPFLTELNQAFESEDTVLIGDLLEYEIAPRIDAFIKNMQANTMTDGDSD